MKKQGAGRKTHGARERTRPTAQGTRDDEAREKEQGGREEQHLPQSLRIIPCTLPLKSCAPRLHRRPTRGQSSRPVTTFGRLGPEDRYSGLHGPKRATLACDAPRALEPQRLKFQLGKKNRQSFFPLLFCTFMMFSGISLVQQVQSDTDTNRMAIIVWNNESISDNQILNDALLILNKNLTIESAGLLEVHNSIILFI